MVESWNDGFKENKTQSTTYSALIFILLMEYFLGRNRKNMTGAHHQKM
jgi:hypothetical protein